jgi:hypothetical protein
MPSFCPRKLLPALALDVIEVADVTHAINHQEAKGVGRSAVTTLRPDNAIQGFLFTPPPFYLNAKFPVVLWRDLSPNYPRVVSHQQLQ